MHTHSIYEEQIVSKGMTAIFVVVIVGLVFVSIYQILVGPLGTRPAPTWVYLLLIVLFLGVTATFSRLRITMTPRFIQVGYGVLKRTIPWGSIEHCYLDEASTVRYGGWGIRIARVKGRWRLVYNVMGGPRIVLSLKEGRFRELAFSTRNPEEVLRVVRQQTGASKSE